MSQDGDQHKPADGETNESASSEGSESRAGERAPLPSWNRTRTKRRDKKSDPTDDAFTRGVRGAGVAAARRGRLVALGIAAVIAAISGGVYAYQQRQVAKADAAAALGRVAALQSRALVGDPELLGLPEEAPPIAPVVADEAARAEATQSALTELDEAGAPTALSDLLRAATSLRGGDAATALSQYESFIRAVPADHPLAFLAQEGIVLAKEQSGDVDGALARLAELLDPPGHYSEAGTFYRDVLLSHRGRLLEAQSKSGEAVAVYRKIHQEFDLSDTNPGVADDFVRQRLDELDPTVLAPQVPAEPSEAAEPPPADTASAGDSNESDE